MSYLIPNSFSTYNLTEADALQGAVFSPLQVQVLQNHLASLAEERLVMEFDINSPNTFIQEEAFKKGQIELMQYLLENSKASQELIDNPPELYPLT